MPSITISATGADGSALACPECGSAARVRMRDHEHYFSLPESDVTVSFKLPWIECTQCDFERALRAVGKREGSNQS